MCVIISDDSENAGYPHRSPWLLSLKENKALRECFWIAHRESLNDCDCCNRRSIEVEFLVEANISCEAPGLHRFGSIRIDWLNPRFTLQEQRGKNGLSYLTRLIWSYFITPRLTIATITWYWFYRQVYFSDVISAIKAFRNGHQLFSTQKLAKKSATFPHRRIS